MRSFTSIFFLALYVLAMVHPALPFIEYEVNQSYIIANLCENNDKPEMKCNGACHLKKQIQEQTGEGEKESTILIDMEKLPVSVETQAIVLPIGVPEIKSFSLLETLKKEDHASKIFHPPTV